LFPDSIRGYSTAPLTSFAAPLGSRVMLVPLNFEYQSYKLSTVIRFDTQTGNAWYFAASDQDPILKWVYIAGIGTATTSASLVPLNFEYQSYKLSTIIRFDAQTGEAWYLAVVPPTAPNQHPVWQWVHIKGITSRTASAKLTAVSFMHQSQKLSTVIWLDTQTGNAWYFAVVPGQRPTWQWSIIK
jgi:hypothetical protein